MSESTKKTTGPYNVIVAENGKPMYTTRTPTALERTTRRVLAEGVSRQEAVYTATSSRQDRPGERGRHAPIETRVHV